MVLNETRSPRLTLIPVSVHGWLAATMIAPFAAIPEVATAAGGGAFSTLL